jgi:hypothetical protein
MGFLLAKPFPVLPGLIVDLSRRDGAPDQPNATVSVKDSGTYVNVYHPSTGITFSQRVSQNRALDKREVPMLDEALVYATRRTLITVGAVMCLPIFTALIGVPLIVLGIAWPNIVRSAGALRTS